MPDLFNIIHFCTYILALIPSVFIAVSIDYPKFVKAKSNINYYLVAFAIICCLTFLMGEFFYNLITMFIK